MLRNFQVSHIFGRTKNPILFTAAWNIVWKAKFLDPFTGHESKGILADKYRTAFISLMRENFISFIDDYNNLVDDYFSEDKIKLAIDSLTDKYGHENVDSEFINQVKENLSKL
mgnify:CR=1 FL=1